MTPGAAVRAPPGMRARRGSGAASRDLRRQRRHVVTQTIERDVVRVASCPYDQIAGAVRSEQVHARELAQLALQPVSPNCAESELRYDDGNAHVSHCGVEPFDVEQPRANTLSTSQQPLDVSGARYSASARKAELRLSRLRRRRTCWEAALSGASGLSSDGGPASAGPTSSPCAPETRAS